jgi:hypothetical protein
MITCRSSFSWTAFLLPLTFACGTGGNHTEKVDANLNPSDANRVATDAPRLNDSGAFDAPNSCQHDVCGCYPNSVCGGACVDTQTDAKNCGACGHACAGGSACMLGACTCTLATGNPGTPCSGACTDTQTDAQNCGACGKVCDGTCSYGGCGTILASWDGELIGLAIDAHNAYLGEGENSVLQVPLQGGTPITLATGTDATVIAVDASSVYWLDEEANSMMKVAIGGGVPVTLATGPFGDGSSLVVHNSTVYFSYQPGADGSSAGAVMAMPTGGGSPVTLASLGFSGYAFSLTLQGANLYWVDPSGAIRDVPIAGGAQGVLASGQRSILAELAVNTSGAYWSILGNSEDPEPTVDALMTVALDGGVPSTIAARAAGGITVDSSSVYWSNRGVPSLITKEPLGGGAIVTVASAGQEPGTIVADESNVYWLDQNGSDGLLMKHPK